MVSLDRKFHEVGQQLMAEMDIAQLEGNPNKYRYFSYAAGLAEEKTYQLIKNDPNRPQTKAIVGNSAIQCYWGARGYQDTVRLATDYLQIVIDPQYNYFIDDAKKSLRHAQHRLKPRDLFTKAGFKDRFGLGPSSQMQELMAYARNELSLKTPLTPTSILISAIVKENHPKLQVTTRQENLTPISGNLLSRISSSKLLSSVEDFWTPEEGNGDLSVETFAAVELGVVIAKRLGSKRLTPEHYLLSLARSHEGMTRLLFPDPKQSQAAWQEIVDGILTKHAQKRLQGVRAFPYPHFREF